MSTKGRLELTWVGKENRPRLEPRILVEDPAFSYGAPAAENMLIHGDNLLALKALEQDFAAKIKCIYIDPPFNTGQAFAQYDDGLEHSIWLSLLRDRLDLLRRLLQSDGSIWVHCDDNEQAYLKVVMDELFGRENFLTAIIWQKVDSPNDNKVPITPDHDYILAYSKQPNGTRFKQMPDPSLLEAYRGPDDEGRMYRDRLLKKNGKHSLRTDRPSMFFPVPAPDGTGVYPMHDDGREACWAMGKENVFKLLAEGKIIWKKRDKNGHLVWVPYTREYAPASPSRPYPSIWTDVQTSRQSKAHLSSLFAGQTPFDTPKPEQLIKRILDLATDEGDWVLDSFAGSGTTGAVAQKMNRQWIMCEIRNHCFTHIVPRLKKVVDGTDSGGVSSLVNWDGGGGFKFYRLAETLLVKDKDLSSTRHPVYVINPKYNSAMLVRAICKIENFRYSPKSQWHGFSSEHHFLHVTTKLLSQRHLDTLTATLGSEEALLVYSTRRSPRLKIPDNVEVKRIPRDLLAKCTFEEDK